MRLEFSDVSWAAFGVTDTYTRLLGTTAHSWVLLDVDKVYYQTLRAVDIVTRYVLGLVESDELFLADSTAFLIESRPGDTVFSSDYISLFYLAKVSDYSSPIESVSFRHSFSLLDFCAFSEVVSVGFRSPFFSAALSRDRIVTDFCVVVRDAVGYNEAFFFNGSFNVDVNNIAKSVDSFAVCVDSIRPDTAATAEFVRVGLRHMVDFYLGGFAIGSVVFGGRVL